MKRGYMLPYLCIISQVPANSMYYCPKPTIYDLSIKIINRDSIDLVFDEQKIQAQTLLLYPEGQRWLGYTFSEESFDGVPFLQLTHFNEYDNYTLELNDTIKLKLFFELELDTDPSNDQCKVYFINKIHSPKSGLICTNCRKHKYNYIIIEQ